MNPVHQLAMYSDLANKIAVVTGASRGIGAATARSMATNGAKVVGNGRDATAIDAMVADIQSKGGRAIGIAADCTDFSAIEHLRERVEQEFGPVDLLAAFAGGGIIRPGPVEKISEEEWRSGNDRELTTTIPTVERVVSGRIERARGTVINQGSTPGRPPSCPPAPYFPR